MPVRNRYFENHNAPHFECDVVRRLDERGLLLDTCVVVSSLPPFLFSLSLSLFRRARPATREERAHPSACFDIVCALLVCAKSHSHGDALRLAVYRDACRHACVRACVRACRYVGAGGTTANNLTAAMRENVLCSNRGDCDVKTGLCDCFPGFSGSACDRTDQFTYF